MVLGSTHFLLCLNLSKSKSWAWTLPFGRKLPSLLIGNVSSKPCFWSRWSLWVKKRLLTYKEPDVELRILISFGISCCTQRSTNAKNNSELCSQCWIYSDREKGVLRRCIGRVPLSYYSRRSYHYTVARQVESSELCYTEKNSYA